MQVSKLTYSVKEMAEAIGISLPNAYELCNRSDFPAIRIGERRIVVPIDALSDWLNKQSAERTII